MIEGVKMSNFHEVAFKKKIDELNQTQQSIQGMSNWLIHHRKHADLITKLFYKEFVKAKDNRKLTFIYLANDIAQNSRKKEPHLGKAFIPTLRKVFEDMGQVKEDKTRDSVVRILNIWKDRGTFESSIIDQLQSSYLRAFAAVSQEEDEDEMDTLIKGITTPPQPTEPSDPTEDTTQKSEPTPRKALNEKKGNTSDSSHRKRTPRKSSSETADTNTAGMQRVKLSPPDSTEPPEEEELIRLFKMMWDMPSTDATTREKIACLPEEIADPGGVEGICIDSDGSRQFASKVASAQTFLQDYNGKLGKELVDRQTFTSKLQNFHASQKDLLGQAEFRLQEHRRHEALLRKRLEELTAHVQNMPDIKKATEEGGLKPLPTAGELFLHK